MHWYKGTIAEAVTASKKKGAVFVVYTEGKDDASKNLTDLIDTSEVSSKLGSDHFVAIKIEANTLPHQQFAEIYKQVTVPSVFFIGKNGLPLEIIKEAKYSEELASKIDGVLKKAGVTVLPKQSPEKPSTGEQTSTTSSANTSISSPKEQKAAVAPPNVVCENGVCTIQKSPTSPAVSKSETSNAESKPVEQKPEDAKTGSPSKELSAEEKVKRAQELIELQRQQKLKEEEDKEKQRELERRKQGQGVQQLRKWQEDQELKQLMEDRERQRLEDKRARERVLAQIAQDKADRAAKFSPPQAQAQPARAQASPPAARRPTDLTVARLQFKLPDGGAHTHEFKAEETLDTVRQYVASTLGMAAGDFALATVFPRREFTQADRDRSLADLQLVPNAVLLVLRLSSGAVTTSAGGGLSGLIWSLFAPLFSILNYVKSFIFGAPAPAGQATGQEPVKRHAPPTEEQQANSYQMKRLRDSTVIRRQGNIARLSDRTDSDDENNTWNGNSTQQM